MECIKIKTKPALTIKEQIDHLKKKGLLFKDEDTAYCKLHHTNYYRLRGYFIDFYKIDNVFYENTLFEDIYNCYTFDMMLHKSILPILETVEVSLKTILAYQIANEKGPLAYRDDIIYRYPDVKEKIVNNCNRYINNHSKSKIVKKHKEFYDDNYPVWVWIEFLSFGDVSLLSNALNDDLIDSINNDFFLFPRRNKGREFLRSWYRSLGKFRNTCSHYERLYCNKLLETPPKITTKKEIVELYDTSKNTSIFYHLLVAVMLCPDIKVVYAFVEDIHKYQDQYKEININKKYGFPDDWEEILLKLNGYYIQYVNK